MFHIKLRLSALAFAAALLAAPVQAQTTEAVKLVYNVNVVNSEDLLDYNKAVVVPTAYVTLLTDGRVSAVKQAGMFRVAQDRPAPAPAIVSRAWTRRSLRAWPRQLTRILSSRCAKPGTKS